ncbi:hypothetical protein E6H31_08885 [Candidatus Bathyarchaeota archaeon]|nr:MAG: hypothetical protein E6H31_08885 [Candidatus Bathyarchaeota archaeon]
MTRTFDRSGKDEFELPLFLIKSTPGQLRLLDQTRRPKSRERAMPNSPFRESAERTRYLARYHKSPFND